jgi:hypothetical protein
MWCSHHLGRGASAVPCRPRFGFDSRMRAVGFIAWSGAVRRLGPGLLLAALIAVAGGAVLGALAGASRTHSAYGRLQAAGRQADIVVEAAGDPAAFDPTIVDSAPGVAKTGVVDGFAMFEMRPDGTFDLDHVPALLAPGDDVAFSQIDRPILVDGRLPDPTADDEIVISEGTRDLGHPVGSTIDICMFNYGDLGALGRFAEGRYPSADIQRQFAGTRCVMRRLRVVGVARPGPDEVVLHPTSDSQQFLVGTPALDADAGQPKAFSFAQVDLRAGASVSRFVNTVLNREPRDAATTVQSNSLKATVVTRTVEPYVRALTLFATAIAIAAIGVLGPSIVRWTTTPEPDRAPLLAMGLRPRQERLVSTLRGAAVGVIAAAGTVTIAILVSGRFPIGVARQIEPHPGARVDTEVMLLGALAIVMVCAALGALAPRASQRRIRRASRIADSLQANGVSPARVAGVRAALGPFGGAGSAGASVAIAIIAVIGALTFQAGLGRLLDTPARYGWTWDAVVDSRDTALGPGVVATLRTSPIVRSVSLGRRTSLLTDGAAIQTFSFNPLLGGPYPTLTAGRAPRGSAEIALGQQTLDRLGKQIGDDLAVRGPNGARVEVRIVGRTLLPLVNLNQDLSVSEGGIVDGPLVKRVGGADVALALVDLEPGKTLQDLRGALGVQGSAASPSGFVLGPTYTADLRGYYAVRQTPLLLAGILALLGLGVLAHTILTTTRRRRRELALLRCLGFLRRDVRISVRWHAITIVVVCLLVGLPLGIALGRNLWSAFARGIGVPSDAGSPSLAALVVAVVTVAGASALAAVPGWRAARLRPAEVLRSE